MMIHFSLPINILAYGGSLSCPCGCAEDLVNVCVDRIKGMKLRIVRTIWGGGQFVDKRCFCSSMMWIAAVWEVGVFQ